MRRGRPFALITIVIVAVACTSGSERRSQPRSPRASAVEPAPTAPTEPPSTTPQAAAPTVWVGSEDGRSVTEIASVTAPEVIRTIPTSGPVHNMIVADGSVVAGTMPVVGRVALVRDGQLIEVDLGGSPHDVKPFGGGLVVTNEARSRIELLDLQGVKDGEVAVRANPHDIAVSPDGGFAWVSLDDDPDLAVIDLATHAVVRYAPTGLRPHDLRFAPDGRLWVTDWNGLLAVLAPDGQELGRVRVGEEAHHLAFGSGGAEVWVTDHSAGQVAVVDAATLAVIASMPIDGAPHHIAVSGQRVFVADHDRGVAVVFDMASRAQVTEVPVPAGPHGVATAPA